MGSYGVPLVFLESTLYWWGGLQEPTLCCTDAYTLLRELLYRIISCNLIISCMCSVVSLVACLFLVSVRRVRNGLRLSCRCSVSRRFCVTRPTHPGVSAATGAAIKCLLPIHAMALLDRGGTYSGATCNLVVCGYY